MLKVVFERKPNVYLPEISAYISYINKHLPSYKAYDSSAVEGYEPGDFDIVWRFMGLDPQGAGRYIVHEYNSLSTGAFAHLKNRIKKTVNKKPDARVFLNEAVEKGFDFKDKLPSRRRDMGVDRSFFKKGNAKQEYDFVYAGSLNRGQAIFPVLDRFKTCLKTATVLIIGAVPDDIHERYGNVENIVFAGRVPYEEVSDLMLKARFGLNLMPDRYPFNLQTATKVLEYCAAGLPVISTDYSWIRTFEKDRQARFFYLTPDLGNLTLKALEDYPFQVPCVDDCEWDTLIEQSKVFDLLPRH